MNIDICRDTPFTLGGCARVGARVGRQAPGGHFSLHCTPYTLHPTPCTLHPTPYTLHPAPYTLRPTTYTLHLTLPGVTA